MRLFRPSRSDHLSNYWNALVRNAPAEELARLARLVEPSEIAAIERARAAHQRYEPDPVFARRLEQTIMDATFSSVVDTIPQPRVSSPSRNGSRDPGPVSRRRFATPPQRSGWQLRPALAIGLVILLILASAGGAWWTINRQDEPQRLLAPEVATPSVDASPDVPMYRGNPARTGVFPGPALAGDPVELWTIQTGEPVNLGAAVVDGVLYIPAGTQGFEARDAMTGDLLWSFPTDAPAISAPAVADGLGYVIDNDGTLYAVHTADGTEAWRMANLNVRSSVAPVDGLVYTVSPEGTFYALEAATGAISWQAELGAEAAGGMAVADGVAYQGNAAGAMKSFNAQTGEAMSTFQNEEGRGNATLTVANGQVYMTISGGDANAMYAVDVDTGHITWRRELGPGLGFISTTATSTLLYSVAEDGKLHAMDAATGETVWEYQLLEFVRSIPVLVEDTLYVADNGGFVRALDPATGEQQWEYPIEGEVDLGWPVVSNGVLYIGTSFGNFYAITGSDMPGASDLAAPADVPMYRGNPERTGVFPGPAINGAPEELWRAETTGSIDSAPAIVDGVMYFGVGDGGVYALDIATGDEIWTFTGSSAINSSPAVRNGIIYVGSEDGTLYALDATDGSEVWTVPGARPHSAVAIVDSTLYIGGDDTIYALDAATGEAAWESPLTEAASRSTAVADGVVYIGTVDTMLHTFDAATGEPGWSVQLEGSTVGTTAIVDGVVYQNTFGGDVNHAYALDAPTGEVLWQFTSPDGVGFGPAAVGEDLVYFPGHDSSIYALDRATGEMVWSFATGDTVGAAPAMVGDTLYAGSMDRTLYALDAATGAEQWRYEADGPIGFGPVITGGVAYFGTNFGTMYAIGGSTTLAAPEVSTPAVDAATPVASAASPVALQPAPTLLWETTAGTPPMGPFLVPTIAPDGTIWVADGASSRFQLFSPDGTFLETWGGEGTGSGDGQFNFVRPNSNNDAFGAVAFAPDGTFYVADTGNQRIQHFDADRTFLNTWGGFGGEDGQFISPIDIDVDADGLVYVGDDRREDLQVFAADGTFLRSFGGNGDPEFQGWITLGPDGTIWGADGGQHLLHQWTGEGELLRTIPVATSDGTPVIVGVVDFESNGNMLVPDGDNGRLLLLDPDGTLLADWDPNDPENPFMLGFPVLDEDENLYMVSWEGILSKYQFAAAPMATPATSSSDQLSTFAWQVGGSDGTLGKPDGLAIAPDGTLWVLDVANATLLHFGADGAPLATIALNDAGAGEFDFSQPSGESYGSVAIDAEGNFYVLDMGNYRVVKLDPDGAYLLAWGERGSSDGKINIPQDLAVSPDGSVYVMDGQRREVLRYTADGEFVTAFGRGGEVGERLLAPARIGVGPDGNVYVADGPGVKVFSPDGALASQLVVDDLTVAIDIAVDPQGQIYVTDPAENMIKVFDTSGALIGTIGEPGSDPGQFVGLDAVAVDTTGGVYALDFEGQRVERFDLTPQSPADAPPVTVGSSGVSSILWTADGNDDRMLYPHQVTVAPDWMTWVADGGNDRFQIFSPDGTLVETWGTSGSEPGQFRFSGPGGGMGGIAFAPDGSFYVMDSHNYRIQHFSADRAFIAEWGTPGTDDGQFGRPYSIAVDSQGNVFVNDDERSDVQKFDADGTHLVTFGGDGSAPGQLNFQADMVLAPDDTVWVADPGNARVNHYANDGTFLEDIVYADLPGDRVQIYSLAVDEQQRVYLADMAGKQVAVFDADGTLVGSWTLTRANGSGFADTGGMALAADGTFYLADWQNGVLYHFQLDPSLDAATPGATPATTAIDPANATVLWETGQDIDLDDGNLGGIAIDAAGVIHVPDLERGVITMISPDGELLGEWGESSGFDFHTPDYTAGAIVADGAGNLYVIDGVNSRIVKFDADRTFVLEWGGRGSGDGEFGVPAAAAIRDDRIYVTDPMNHRVQVFDLDGTFITAWGVFGADPGNLNTPVAIAVMPDGTVYVSEEATRRIQHFTAEGAYLGELAQPDPGTGVVYSLAVDDAGNLWAASSLPRRVMAFTPDGSLIVEFTELPDAGFLDTPASLAFDADGNLVLAIVNGQDWTFATPSNGRGRVVKVDLTPDAAVSTASPAATTATARIVWESDDADADLSHAHQVTLAPDGTIWVADGANSRFQIFDQDGILLEVWGADGVGEAEGQFNFVKSSNRDGLGGVAFAPDGSFYVMDTGNYRIQHFDAERNFLNSWGVFGSDEGQFISPISIGIDAQGNVYVSDSQRHDIQKFDPDGSPILAIDVSVAGPQLPTAQGFIAIAPDDTIWLALPDNKLVLQFGSDGALLASIAYADIPGNPVWVQALAVDAGGRVYLPDTDGSRLFVLDADGSVLGPWSLTLADGSPNYNSGGMVVTADGSIFLADWANGTLYRYELDPPLDAAPAAPAATPEATPVN